MANLMSGYGTQKPCWVGSRITVQLGDAIEENVSIIAYTALIEKCYPKYVPARARAAGHDSYHKLGRPWDFVTGLVSPLRR